MVKTRIYSTSDRLGRIDLQYKIKSFIDMNVILGIVIAAVVDRFLLDQVSEIDSNNAKRERNAYTDHIHSNLISD